MRCGWNTSKASGFGRYTRIISIGCEAPDVLLDECSEAFLGIFMERIL